MASNKITPQNVNKSPDNKKSARKKTQESGKETTIEKEPVKKKNTGIDGTQLGTEKGTDLKKGKVTTRKFRDLG